jgi:hypothetical protein
MPHGKATLVLLDTDPCGVDAMHKAEQVVKTSGATITRSSSSSSRRPTEVAVSGQVATASAVVLNGLTS